MLRRHFLALGLSSLVMPAWAQGTPARADVIQLTAEQINTLLSGNTITGTWSGTGYKQYFGDDGMTVYIPDGGAADRGRWRTNTEADTYES